MTSLSITDCWRRDLATVARPEKVGILSSFFKTGKGEYGYGDRFIGVTGSRQPRHSRALRPAAGYDDIAAMLDDPVHEHRLSGFLALVQRYRKAKSQELKQETLDFYLANAHKANNWDLVDLSAPYILGAHLVGHPDAALLDRLSHSSDMWVQRIAIVSTLMLIRNGRYDDTLRIARHYLDHPHPLIHKATGWTLRETGKTRPQRTAAISRSPWPRHAAHNATLCRRAARSRPTATLHVGTGRPAAITPTDLSQPYSTKWTTRPHNPHSQTHRTRQQRDTSAHLSSRRRAPRPLQRTRSGSDTGIRHIRSRQGGRNHHHRPLDRPAPAAAPRHNDEVHPRAHCCAKR